MPRPCTITHRGNRDQRLDQPIAEGTRIGPPSAPPISSANGVMETTAIPYLRTTNKSGHTELDIAFNNAGISPPEDDSILTTGIDAWRRVQEVNLTSVYLCSKYAINHMLDRGSCDIST
ncbi:SDR family oxidoreductase [Nocardia sp. CA-135953]|uniref:SDR family oxidoreductase n=1 Tax=Nocardia sp. CA-135953 TaxID=3239978 RepID=UPI003D95B801